MISHRRRFSPSSIAITPVWQLFQQRASLVHEPNAVRILRIARDKGAVSRAELAKLTGLHKATITDHVSKLIRAGFLEERGDVEPRKTIGRKRIVLRFVPLAGLVAGVDVGFDTIVVSIADLNAHVLRQESFEYGQQEPVNEVLAKVIFGIHSLLSSLREVRPKLVGIGMGIQGVIDHAANTLLVSQNKKSWEGVPLSTPLETEFKVPVFVENDVKTMALGEYLFGTAKGTRGLIHIWVGRGLGAGVLINGHILHGITSSAGEIGFNGLEDTGYFRSTYPLLCTGQAIFGEILNDANLCEAYGRGASPSGPKQISVELIARLALAGDAVANQVINEFISLLSMVCIPMVNLLNPEVIILGGKLSENYPSLASRLQEKIQEDLLAPPAKAVKVLPASHGERSVVLGAAGLVLHELFEPVHSFSRRNKRRLEMFVP